MALSLPEKLKALQVTLSTRFQNARGTYTPRLAALFDEEPSGDAANLYAWPTRQVKMREWIGERRPLDITGYAWQVENKTFELTLEVRREHVEDDKFGFYNKAVDSLSQAIDVHLDDFGIYILQNGADATKVPCYDGKALFATDHPIYPKQTGSSTFRNYYTSTALTVANFEAKFAEMCAYLGDDGLPFESRPTHLVIPPQLRATANRIIKATQVLQTDAGGTSYIAGAAVDNPNKDLVQIIECDRLSTEATAWYLACLSKPIKPLIHQTRRAFEFISMFDPSSEMVFKTNKYMYGIDGRDAATVSLPQLIMRCVG